MSLDPWSCLGPMVRLLPAERAHGLALAALQRGLVPGPGPVRRPELATSLWGLDFANPIGLAAGFDKDARAVRGAFRLGFGFVEIGSVTPRPQRGNPRPRLFRLPDERAVINRMGFNSEGLEAAAARLRRLRAAGALPGPLGGNLAKNKETAEAADDYEAGIAALGRLVDYLVVNVSSPNTPGLRALQRREALGALLARCRKARDAAGRTPLLVKVAPDLNAEERADIAAVVLEHGMDGLIVGNTTVARPPGLRGRHATEAGGLSGRPLLAPSTEVLADFRRLTAGRIPLVGCGGVASGRDAYAKVRAGASLVQLYTAMVYDGPRAPARIAAELADLLRADGFAHVGEAVGRDVDRR